MLVTVALPIYNGANHLPVALASILNQQNIELEVVVSDDGSSDNSLHVVERIRDSRVRLLSNTANAGIFGNLNRCVESARGDLIQVFSQDDVMQPGYLASQVACLARYPDAGLVYGKPDYIDASGHHIEAAGEDTTPELIEWPLYLWIASHYGALPPSISSIMFPRRTIEMVGCFDPSFRVAGDVEFYNRVATRFPIIFNREMLHSVRSHRFATSSLPTAGRKYLEEEARLAPWFRSRLGIEDYVKVIRFRSAIRGRYHLGWIVRTLMRGQLLQAGLALWQLNRLYPIHQVLMWRFRFLIHPQIRPYPELPAPSIEARIEA
jgi:glycosyltransferase involved in cell wall biosynthesis